MNSIFRQEREILVHGVPARAFNVVVADNGRILNQTVKTEAREYREGGVRYRIRAGIRFDDSCGNGHESFAITADGDAWERGRWCDAFGGCCHEEIARRFPELAPLIPWHLCSTDGPMHYLANTVYLAGDRDCHGLRKGEVRQIRNGKTGLPCWRLAHVGAQGREVSAEPDRYVDRETQPECTVRLAYVPWTRTGEGKARELDAARRVAIWPEATDEELMQEPEALRAMLTARLPALLERFKAAMLAAGLHYPAPR